MDEYGWSWLAAILLLSGCGATRGRSGAPEQSGFLGDYSGLTRNPAYPAALVYVKPGVQWARYSTIQLDSQDSIWQIVPAW